MADAAPDPAASQGNPRLAMNTPLAADDRTRKMFGRAMALWAGDLLRTPPHANWRRPSAHEDALADYRDHDWRRLYVGSVLDD